MRDVLILLLGWLLGLLSPLLAEKIQRPRRRAELTKSVLYELDHLRYVLTGLSYKLLSRAAAVDRDFIRWILPILETYTGPGAEPKFAELYKKQLEMTDDQLRAMYQAMRTPGSGVGLKKYSLPFLESQIQSLSICPLEFQQKVLNMRAQLELLNQEIEFARYSFQLRGCAILS